MQNQINMDDQNNQQTGENSLSQEVQIPEKSKVNYWMIATGALFILLVVVGLYALNLNKKIVSQSSQPNVDNPTVTQQLNPTEIPTRQENTNPTEKQQESSVPKTYSNPKYPNFKILYDSGWNLNSTEIQSTNVSGAIDTLITLKKNGTSLFFDIKVGTPMGGEPSCFSKSEKPYSLVSNNLLRYKDITYGNYYWQGAIVKEQNEKQFNEQMSVFTDAFNCQKNNSCSLCYTSGDFETAITRTTYPLPNDGVDYGQNKFHGALVKAYVKQNVEDQTLLKEVDKIVQDSLNSSK